MDTDPQPTTPAPTAPDRRRFFALGMRGVALGGIAAFVAMQEFKRRCLIGDPNCVRLNTCSDCIEFSAGCSKDKTENFRAGRRT